MDLLNKNKEKPRILLVEDNPGDIRLTQEALYGKMALEGDGYLTVRDEYLAWSMVERRPLE